MTISICTRPSRREDGKRPLYVRISHKGKKRYRSLSHVIEARHWHPNGYVRKTHPDHHALNEWLSGVKRNARELEAELAGKDVTLREIVQAFDRKMEGGSIDDFVSYAEALIENDYRRRGRHGTARAYQSVLNKFTDFLEAEHGRKEIAFSALDIEVLRGFKTFMVEKGNSGHTVHKGLSTLRTFVRSAMKEGHIPRSDYPFEHMTLSRPKVSRDKLSPEEMEAFREVELEEDTLIWHCKNYFLFSYYAGGMRFGDMAFLTWDNIKGDRLVYTMRKTKERMSIALVDPAKEIISHYKHRREKYVFPIFDGSDLSTGEKRSRVKEAKNALINKYLKKIAKKAGIKTNISFHLARHSIAHRMYKRWGDIYRVKEVLGHGSIRITEAYLSGFDDTSLDDDFKDLF